jgi:hypothetical protein
MNDKDEQAMEAAREKSRIQSRIDRNVPLTTDEGASYNFGFRDGYQAALEHAGQPQGERFEVVSEPDAAIKVTKVNLTDAERESLSINHHLSPAQGGNTEVCEGELTNAEMLARDDLKPIGACTGNCPCEAIDRTWAVAKEFYTTPRGDTDELAGAAREFVRVKAGMIDASKISTMPLEWIPEFFASIINRRSGEGEK